MKYKVPWYNPKFEFPDNWNELDYVGGNGPEVEQLEHELSKVTGAEYNLAVNNGTSALLTAMMAIKQKYEWRSRTTKTQSKVWKVGIPDFTFIATYNTARFVFGPENVIILDVDPDTWNVSPEVAKEAMEKHGMNLLVTVDVGGIPCDYQNLSKLGIPIIADSAESLGSNYLGEPIGTQALVHTFSLHRAKVVSCGEGGAVSTTDQNLANIMKDIINHGYLNSPPWRYLHHIPALNFRMTNVHGALARKSLSKIKTKISARKKIAKLYNSGLDFWTGIGMKAQNIPDWADSNYFFYGVTVNPDFKDNIIRSLEKKGIEVKSWSAVSDAFFVKRDMHQPKLGRSKEMMSHKIADGVILLPIHDGMDLNQTQYVINTFNNIIRQIDYDTTFEENRISDN